MKTVFLVAIAILIAITGVAGQQPIDIHQARYYVGHRVTIEDTVAQVTREAQSGFTYLNFGGEFPRQVFRVVIPDTLRTGVVSEILTYPHIRVTGIPHLDVRGIPEIVCTEPSQITALMPSRPVSEGTRASASSVAPD